MNQNKYQSRILGVVAAIGGVLWSVWVFISATRPLLPPDGYRDSEDLSLLMGVAMLCMAVGVVGIYWRQKDNATWLAKIGLYASVIGAIMGMIGNVLITFYGTNLILVPIFFGGGSILLMLGMVLTGISIIQGDSLPRWSGWLLIGGVVFALFFGDENSSSILLLLSVGIAWIIIGGLLSLSLPSSLKKFEGQA
jgi:hypothetical protein